jgi:hypothetical protein
LDKATVYLGSVVALDLDGVALDLDHGVDVGVDVDLDLDLDGVLALALHGGDEGEEEGAIVHSFWKGVSRLKY